MSVSLEVWAQDELCTEGILLFREDFGGNTPYYSRVGQTPVAGMSYTQLTADKYVSMSAGKYIVTKSGFCNGDTTGWTLPDANLSARRSQWYIQDDHTYPNDYSRGYFMEIDGNGGNQQFYETEINGLCEGIELTFSAYVANVFTWFQYDWYTKNRGEVIAPCLKFVLTDPTNNTVLASKETGNIPFDEDLPALTDWQYSSKWHLVGMNFTVPVGVEAIRLSIYNNVVNGNGNDFALDDIEIRLCRTAEVYTTDTTVCDTVSQIIWRGRSYQPAEVLRDTLTGSCGFDSIYYILNVQTEHCEEPVQADLCTEGILLFREDFGGNDPSAPDVSTSPVPSMSSNYQQIFKLSPTGSGQNMDEGCYLVAKRGYHNSTMAYYSDWHIMDDHTYPYQGGIMADRGYFMEINGKRVGQDIFYSTTIDVRESEQLSFSAYVANVVTAGQFSAWNDPNYVYPKLTFVITDPQTGEELAHYDTDTIGHDWNNYPKSWELSAEWQLVGMNFTVPAGVKRAQFSIRNNAVGTLYTYRGNDLALDDIEIRLCRTAEVYTTDTTVCDTVSQIFWRGRSYQPAEVLRDTFPSVYGYDSIYYILNVQTEQCGSVDPPTPPEPEKYPLIVNKYNWVLLLDNVTFARLFPGRYARTLQWYRNEEPIAGANDDDYSEQNELNGRFQLRLDLDNGQTIWSNILEINTKSEEQPIQVYIYDSRGVPVREEQAAHGFFLYRYEQGEQVWTEKKLIP